MEEEPFRMARCDTTERIAATPSRVWTEFRPERMKRWYGPEIEVISPGPLSKGSRIRISGRSGVKAFGYEATVTEYHENRALGWEGADENATYHVLFQLNPKDGGTVVFMRDEFRLKGVIGKIIEKVFMARRVAKYDRHFLRQLKELIEQKD